MTVKKVSKIDNKQLEHIPAELNRRDSQERAGGRVWQH
jgi:hypothetical protein